MKRIFLCGVLGLGLWATPACIKHQVEGGDKPLQVEVKPIHITMDLNIRVQIENDLADVFGHEKGPSQ